MTQTTGDFGRSTMYRAEWRDGEDVERWLSRMATGRTLCFPCGSMLWGDVRADIDAQHDPDVLADIRDPPFDYREFDTVYCDPPYSMCRYDSVYDFVLPLWDVADERLIVNMPNIRVHIKNADYSLYAEGQPPHPALTLYHVYDRPDSQLSDFGGDE